MQLKLLEKKENPLLSRSEVKGELTFDGATPKEADVKKLLATTTKSDEKLVKVKNIYTHNGHQKADIHAHIYTDEKVMKELEKEKKKKGDKKAPKSGAPAAPAEQPKKEDKKEEAKKEEDKKEEKPKEKPKKEGEK